MNIGLTIAEAFINLTTSKLRSFLALLGILVGTASVVAMISGGRLATQAALMQIKRLGTNLLSVSLYGQSSKPGDSTSATPIYMSLSDVLKLPEVVQNVYNVGPYTQVYASLYSNGHSLSGTVMGVTQALQSIVHVEVMKGRFISDLDRDQFNCVLGHKLYQTIQSMNSAEVLGTQVRVGQQYCTVVGVLKPWLQNSFIYTNLDQALMIPLSASLLLNQNVHIENMVLRVHKHVNFSVIQKDAMHYIQGHSRNLHLYFQSPQQLLNSARKQSDILTVFLGFIGSISLLVGGIGVMNIMLVSVVERRREIGIRMAVGARRRDIQSLFLVESTVLSLCGGIFGVLLGVLTSFIIAKAKGWAFSLFLLPPTIGFTVSALVGIFFGFYPAYKASKLDPIEALKSE